VIKETVANEANLVRQVHLVLLDLPETLVFPDIR
jgi:hypothetical protein